jgi:GTP-binding protein
MEIIRAKTTFKYGFNDPNQLLGWLEDNPTLIGVCFVGRSNVGKSSSINALFGNKTARISKTPGRTREINVFTFEVKEYPGQEFYLFDLPGYGFAKISKDMSQNWNELMHNFFENVAPSVIVANLQDARRPNQSADIEFSKYISKTDLSTFLILNKIDKLKTQKERSKLNKLKPELFKQYKNVKRIHFVSAESKAGIKELEDSLITSFIELSNL